MTVGGGGGGGGVTVLACLPLPDRLASLDSVAWSEHSQLAFATRKGVFVYTVSPSRGSRAPSSNQMNFIKTFLRNTDGGGEGAGEDGNVQRPGGELSRLAARVDWSPATSPAPAPLLCVLTADHRFKLYRQQGRAWLLHSDPGRTLAGHSRGAGRVTAWTWGEPGILYTAHQGGHLACLQWDQVWLSGLQCQLMVLCSNPGRGWLGCYERAGHTAGPGVLLALHPAGGHAPAAGGRGGRQAGCGDPPRHRPCHAPSPALGRSGPPYSPPPPPCQPQHWACSRRR